MTHSASRYLPSQPPDSLFPQKIGEPALIRRRRSQFGRSPPAGARLPKMARRWSKMAPRMAPDGTKTALNGPKMAQDAPKTGSPPPREDQDDPASRQPKTKPKRTKIDPRRLQKVKLSSKIAFWPSRCPTVSKNPSGAAADPPQAFSIRPLPSCSKRAVTISPRPTRHSQVDQFLSQVDLPGLYGPCAFRRSFPPSPVRATLRPQVGS